MQLGLENKKKAMWAAVLGGVALLVLLYEIAPFFAGSSTPAASAQAAAPLVSSRAAARATSGGRPAKKVRAENLDPTLRLDLLATSEQTQYEGSGRNIFVASAEPGKIQTPLAPGVTDPTKPPGYVQPTIPPPPPIPLKFFGFASKVGEPKKIFLSTTSGEDVWVASEGEIVNRRYKVMKISPNSVEIQDMVNSGPPQNIPLTPG